MEIVIKFDKKNYTKSGLTSSASWRRLLPYIHECFGIQPCEVLTGIEVTEDGITARFVTRLP